MDQYNSLMKAIEILYKARLDAASVDPNNNPAWVKLLHAGNYLGAQAKAMLAEVN